MESQLLYELYEAYAGELTLYLYSLCRDRELASDLLQEDFLEMMGEWPENYPAAAEYVREHGLTFLGMAVYEDQETLQKLLEHPLVAVVDLKE